MKQIAKTKRRCLRNNLENYDDSTFVYRQLLLVFTFAMIFASLSSNLLIIYPTSNDNPDNHWLNDIFEKVSDIVTGFIQSSPKTVRDEPAMEETGIQIIVADHDGNLQEMQAVDGHGNLIYRITQNPN